MSIIRTKRKKHNFTIIDNTGLIDPELTWKETGLLAFLMTKPDDWEISIKSLTNNKKDSRDSVASALAGLQEKGYVYRQDYREKGRFKTEYLVFETKEDLKIWLEENPPNPNTAPERENRNGKTGTEKPERKNRNGKTVTENPDQVINIEIITDLPITEKVITEGEDARENFSIFHPPTPSNKGNGLREESTTNTRQNYPDRENNFLFAPSVDNNHHHKSNHPAPLANPENLTDIQQWANKEIGHAIKLYRKSGVILTGGCDINGDFAVFVGRRNSRPGHQDLAGLGFNVILKCEKSPERWQQLVIWTHDWSNGGNVATAAANQQQQQEIKEIDPETAKQLKELGIEI